MDEDQDRSSERAQHLWPHLVVLVVALAAVWPLLRFDGVFTVDEGSYALQARTLGEGTWDMGYAFIEADPEGRFLPFYGSGLGDGEVVAYSKHPLVPLAMRWAAVPLGEEVGFRLWGVASVAALALTAWALAGDLGLRRARPWAFWIAATSPVLANAWLLWPHGPSALAAGIVVLAAHRSQVAWRWTAIAMVGAAAGVLLRSEAVLWAGATGTGLALASTTMRQRVTGVIIAVGGATAFVVERSWRSDVGTTVGSIATEERGPGTSLVDRLRGMKVLLVDGAVGSDAAIVLSAVVLALLIVVVMRLLRADIDVGPGVLLLLSAVLLAVRFAVASDDPALGLLAAAPALALAVACRCLTRSTAWIPVILALYAGALTFTIYSDGGAFQWGGRFASPMLAPLAALAGVAVAARLEDGIPVRISVPKRLLAGGVVSLLLVQAAGAIFVPDQIRDSARQRLASVTRLGQSVNVSGGQMIPRLDWRDWPNRCWIAIPHGGGAAEARAVLDVLASSGVAEAAYAGVDPDILEAAGAAVTPDKDNELVGTLRVPAGPADSGISPPYRCTT